MQPSRVLSVDEIDLSDVTFWQRPIEEREGAFATLRAERPISFYEESEIPNLEKGPGYWAVTRYADVADISRRPGPDFVINAETRWLAPRPVPAIRGIRLRGGWLVPFCWG